MSINTWTGLTLTEPSAKEVSQSWQTGPTEVLIYSLKSHTVVKRLGTPPLDDPKFGTESSSVGSDPGEDFSSVYEIAANSNFVAIVCPSTYTACIVTDLYDLRALILPS